MIIRGWSIDGFGLFHQEECRDLGDGLTVVLGPNESGKSTMIAFVRGVLFGFPDRRSRDPQYPPLHGGRHGGRLFLDTAAGPLIVQREAGRLRPPLVTLPGGRLGTGEDLEKILGGLDQAVFRSIFAFGLSELNDFAALDTGGIGRRLFAAGITGAGRSAREALDTLGHQAGQLLRPRGRSAIGSTLGQLTRLEERITTARNELDRHPHLVREEEEQCLELEQQSREADRLRSEEKRLERLLELWPSWNQRRQAAELLALLPAGAEFEDPGDRLSRLVDRLEDEADQDRESGGQPTRKWAVPVFLAVASAAGLFWCLRTENWLSVALYAVGASASVLALTVSVMRHLRARRLESVERERRAADSAANLAAAASDLAGLRRTLSATARRQSLEQTIRQVDALVAARTGVDRQAATFVEELDSGSVSSWERALARVRQQLAGTVERRDQAIRRTEALRRQREALEQSADLPALETEAQTLRSRLDEEAGQWRLLVTARGLVEQALREYIAGRQPAVLNRASGLISTVTGGRYIQVVHEAEGNSLTLLGGDGSRVGTADLSRGTAEQLYLCLRLALAGDHADRGSPLPLLMDDVLVNADPDRVAGLAAAIREFASGGQVLLFTCHPHTAELLQDCGGGVETRRLASRQD